MIKAEIICDSIATTRLTTFKLRYPRFIHAEFMTHRMISRNASSSRALPVAKLLEEVRSDELRAAPVFWGAEQKGMQAGGQLDDNEPYLGDGSYIGSKLDAAHWHWRDAAIKAADNAEALVRIGLHKSIANRLLEPFSHINVVATATEWDNFFGLRLHKDAEPTMRALAVAMWEARAASRPKELKPGEWHLPFADDAKTWDDMEEFSTTTTIKEQVFGELNDKNMNDYLIRVSVARCARVSYESFPKVLEDGTIVPGKRSTIEEDLKLYDRLVGAQPLHASPAEHQATPDTNNFTNVANSIDILGKRTFNNWHQHGNFVGWRQFRKMLSGEAQAPLPEEYR